MPRRKVRVKTVDSLPRLPADDPRVVQRWQSCLGMVRAIARKQVNRGAIAHPYHEDELVAELEFRLLDLARVYDPDRPTETGQQAAKFSTLVYSVLSREVSGHLTKITRGGLTGLTGSRGKGLSVHTNPASTYGRADDDSDGPLDSLTCRATTTEYFAWSGVQLGDDLALLCDALAGLLPRERYSVTWYYGLGGRRRKTLSEIGKTLGVSRERVRVLVKTGVGVLRKKLNPAREDV